MQAQLTRGWTILFEINPQGIKATRWGFQIKTGEKEQPTALL
jgi:hypothetical protein